MRRVTCWNDLQGEGIIPLTGESCGLMYRILFDVTERGRKILGKCFGIPDLKLSEAWNRGSTEDPHVGSIMLSLEMLPPIAVFALFETCKEVWLGKDVIGIEPGDSHEEIQAAIHFYQPTRRLRRAGTAGDRNVHVFTGRVT
jgi:hypothetical protein